MILDGGFTEWKNGPCNAQCEDDTGYFTRTRTCTNPLPGLNFSHFIFRRKMEILPIIGEERSFLH